jgi:hypothetical protein
MTIVPFAEYLPDLPALQNPGATKALNVLPDARSYRPLKGLAAYSADALDARCQGAVSVRDSAGNYITFAGDAAKLYSLDSLSWTDRSKSGGYTTSDEGVWEFCQFRGRLVATNYNQPIQTLDLDAFGPTTLFADLSSDAPRAKTIAPVRDWLFAGNLEDSDGAVPHRLRWSAFNDATSWPAIGSDDAAEQQSDQRDLKNGDLIRRILGGQYATILCANSVWLATLSTSALIFDLAQVEEGRGCLAQGSAVQTGDIVYYLSEAGFFRLAGGVTTPIGAGKVDRTFFADCDTNYLNRVQGAVDPAQKIVYWAYPGSGSSDGRPNKLLIYSWAYNRWSHAEVEAEYMFRHVSTAATLDDVHAAFPDGIDTIPGSLDDSRWQGGAVNMAGFDTDHKLGHFAGDNLAATVETGEAQLMPGRRALVTGIYPLVDGAAASVTLGTRNRQSETVTWGTETAPHADTGMACLFADARYHRARVSIAASADWEHATGIDPEFTDSGAN